MAFWDRFKKKPAVMPQAPAPQAAPAKERPLARARAADAPELVRLRSIGEPEGPDVAEALALLRALRSTPDEARAIDAVRAAASARDVPEPLRVAAAAALVERGDVAGALPFVWSPRGQASSPEGRILAADLHAAANDLPAALAIVERVLVRDLDYPGARERHRRWRAQLGLDAATAPTLDPSAVTVVSRAPEAPFLLLREVARGGSGAVYEAEDRELSRRVALKVYHHPDRDRAQLLHEARVAASLAGEGIVRVLDADPDHGWLALEWAGLGSLRGYVRARDRAVLTPIARWALPLAATLARTHAAGWVHHDVKPANVLFASVGRPILADFGTARRTGAPSAPGSLGYVSPERLAGRASDPRDDVFGFGRILEDAMGALGEDAVPPVWRIIAAACTGPDGARPGDGRALATRLRVEAAGAA